MGGRSLGLFAFCFLLASCSHKAKTPPVISPPPPPPPVVAPQPVAEEPVPLPLLKPAPPVLSAPSKTPKPLSVTPDELIGLDEAGVEQLLGTTPDIRNEGVARIMTFKGEHCTVDVVFFMDLKAGGLRVASYQLNDDQPNRASSTSPCYPTLRISK